MQIKILKGSNHMRVLAGIQPSGIIHLGNYLGAIRQFIALQDKYESYFFIANYHAMTTVQSATQLKENTLQVAMDYLALGLDPQKSALFVQSDLPELNELAWILSTVTGMGLLERCHSFKDKVAKNITPNHALFAYPVLMAADILMYKSNLVPVGKDQIQHLEVTRDIAIRFNNVFQENFFPLPEAYISSEGSIVPGTDGQKMSKSHNNTICMFDPEKKIRKAVMSIQTDSLDLEEPKNPDNCNVFKLYALFANESQKKDLEKRYKNGGLGYGHAKQELFDLLMETFKEPRQRRSNLEKDKGYVLSALKIGAEKAKKLANQTMEEVRKITGLNYL